MNNEKIRFGPFELDPKAGELRHGRRRVRLQERPLKMLVALLATPGEVVTREELRARLWPAKVFVDFDNGLNNAVNKLRTALGDSAAKPEYIETVGRRGYRFIGSVAAAETPPVQTSPPRALDPVAAAATRPTARGGSRRRARHRCRDLHCAGLRTQRPRRCHTAHRLSRRAAAREPLERSRAGVFLRRHDGRADLAARRHPLHPRDLPSVGDAIQRQCDADAGSWHASST